MDKPIYVTQPSLPPLEDFIPYLEQIWDSRVLTNNGPFHQQFEDALCEYLDVPYISLFANGTIALATAFKALGLQGEVITTPYTFVATAHALTWNGLTPVFIDIDPVTLNLDPEKIEAAITDKTTAILPVHVYGHPCDVDAIELIAKKHELSVIYDAAHAFGVRCHCGSLLNHGDLSVLSFHATKVFNTFEGGAIVCQDLETKTHIDQLKNFGFVNETTIARTGINGKMNELSAALGLLQLQHIDENIKQRKAVDEAYRDGLKNVEGIRCHNPPAPLVANYGYFPIFLDKDYPLSPHQLQESLKHEQIYCRRYFYPTLTQFNRKVQRANEESDDLLNAKEKSRTVLCLPISPSLTTQEITRIVRVIKTKQKTELKST